MNCKYHSSKLDDCLRQTCCNEKFAGEPGDFTGEKKFDRATPFAPAVIAPAQMAFSSIRSAKPF